MNPLIASAIYIAGIVGLFVLDRDRKARTSAALWLPIAWLLITASRPVSMWLQQSGPSGGRGAIEEGSPIDRTIFLALLIAGVMVLMRKGRGAAKFLRANPAILVFIFYCVVSTAWSDYPDVALKRWMKSLGDMAMVLIVLTERDRSAAIKRLVTTVAFILIPVSVLLIKYYPEVARYYSPYEGTMFVSGVALDKNALGMTCMVFGLGIWWRLLGVWTQERGRERTRRMIALGSVLALMFWLFWLAHSPTSESCFAMAAGIMAAVMLVRAARKPALVHIMAVTAVCVSFSALFLGADGGALKAMGRNPTLTGRTDIWKGVLHFAGNPIFGTGFESFWLGGRLARIWAEGGLLYGINESHDGYLEIYLNEGWIGVALLAVILVVGYRKIVRAVGRDPQTYCLHLAFFVTAVIYNLTEAAFKTNHPLWIILLWAIMAASTTRWVTKTAGSPLGVAEKSFQPFAIQPTSV